MDVTEVFDKLKDLQKVLLRINELEAEIANAPTALKKHEELLARLKQEYIEKNQEFELLRTEINKLKGELFETEKKRENSEKNMEAVETQKDYEALEKSIKDAKIKEEQIRHSLQHENNRFEAINEDIKESETIISENEIEIKKMQDSLDSEINKKNDELTKLENQKAEISKGLGSETIFNFERIVKSKEGDGIVAVNGGVCTGCNMILPSQFANEIQAANELKYCPYCSRVLYYEVADVEMDEFSFDDAEIGGLMDLTD